MAVLDTANIQEHYQTPTSHEIEAATKAFLLHNLEQKIHLLAVMPVQEAVAILNRCPLSMVRVLLDKLAEQDEVVRVRQIASGLGLINSEVEPDGDYLSNSVMSHVWQRIGWIIGLALMGVVSGLIISHYEDAISQLVLLAIYMPVVAAAGGNAGSQAATLVVRALAMNEIRPRQWLQVMWKEFRVSLVIAAALALVIMGRVAFATDTSQLPANFSIYAVAMAIGTALMIQVTLSTTVGGVLPLIARKLKLDPAVLVSPVLASIVDITGMAIYFTTVNAWLGLI
ncbi:magnesium transporter [Veronia pacifica]|uniref:Mg2+ transporter mgtE n=1 Tax=Veronia pacifica TaxID=1080227 RepID=A0A1C3EK22_9GAMM|nr:magnesium transporter [Veronia pacifica]ODA33587.1 Mg2+ transporter mgtE [Veronia pacifica]